MEQIRRCTKNYNTNAEKASSGIDLRHRWVTSAIYNLPFGGKSGLQSGNAVARVIADAAPERPVYRLG
ncbi:MAG: hypothetical protein AB7U82_35945 [Blastocatellales bacterium]|nr:hypothetical protein [Nitrosomonas nitrosa]